MVALLRIKINQQYALPGCRKTGREIDTRRGLADAAFLVGNREDFRHRANAPD